MSPEDQGTNFICQGTDKCCTVPATALEFPQVNNAKFLAVWQMITTEKSLNFFLIIKTLIKTNAFLVTVSLGVANAADVGRPNA